MVAWESVVSESEVRPWGYVASAVAGLVALVAFARGWGAPAPDAETIAARLERLFPQARGSVLSALTLPGPGLEDARAAASRGWIARRGGRLDAALAVHERPAAARARRWAVASVALLAATVAVEAGAARRAASAVVRPATLWRDGAWRVEPGHARLPYGAAFEGKARLLRPQTEGHMVLEWAEGDGVWRAETLGPGPERGWRWDRLAAPRAYRLRLGSHTSRLYRVEIGAPLAVRSIEARAPGAAWAPLAGGSFVAGSWLEIRGRANDGLVTGRVVSASGESATALNIEGSRFGGRIRLAAGSWRVELQSADGRSVATAPFLVNRGGNAYVHLLHPAEDPTRLAAASTWIEVRAGASTGIRALSWETADQRRGRLGDPAGARDTILAALAPIAAGRGPGDTVRYRVVAVPRRGAPVATPWRTAIVDNAAAIRDRVAGERDLAVQAIERAAAGARAASERGTDVEAAAAERSLEAAADSLAAALEQVLADPELPLETREELEAYGRMLKGVAAAALAPREGSATPAEPAARAWARGEVLRTIAEAVARAEAERTRAAAADSLSRLAGEERRLAEETRRTPPERTADAIGPRQESLAHSARAAARNASEDAAEKLDQALDRAEHELAAGDPSAAARAQEEAAGAMSRAAEETRAESERDRERRAVRRAAVDRAAGETLFLAERQRAVAERLTLSRRGPAEHSDRLARQRVVSRGLERTLATLVEAIGGQPAGEETARLLAQAVYATRAAENALARAPERAGSGAARIAAEEATAALALLAREFLLPPLQVGMAGAQGAGAEAGALARQLDAMASAQRSIADAAARSEEEAGGNPEAAAAERQLGQEIAGLGEALETQGVDPRAIEALASAVESAARRLERGLPGARTQTDLRSLARRFADLGRMLERREGERRAEAARAFVPTQPPPLPARATARRLDAEAALAPWVRSLPGRAVEPARRYLERLEAEGVRAPSEAP